jgi:K+-sensing histidine kinase KdpD
MRPRSHTIRLSTPKLRGFTSPPTQVHSDPSLVEQILRNLVANAIKYTREGWVRLRCLHEAPLIRLEVLDTGIGIPADKIPHIYEEFYCPDSIIRRTFMRPRCPTVDWISRENRCDVVRNSSPLC